MRKNKGFTLVELMVTIAVMAIVLGLGVPSLAKMIAEMQLTSASNNYQAFLNYARSEAAKRNGRIVICISQDGATCLAAATDWSLGAIAFFDDDKDSALDVGTDVVLRVQDQLREGLSMTATTAFATVGYFYFSSSGISSSAGTLTICKTGYKARDLVVNTVGRVTTALGAVCS